MWEYLIISSYDNVYDGKKSGKGWFAPDPEPIHQLVIKKVGEEKPFYASDENGTDFATREALWAQQLNKIGGDGWELIKAPSSSQMYGIWIFKRQIESF